MIGSLVARSLARSSLNPESFSRRRCIPATLSPSTKCAAAIKPVMWILNGYQGPSGTPVSGGFVREHGFGGEEWNGRADRVWKGRRVCHTETKPKLDLYAGHANLALVMIAMHNDIQYVVGGKRCRRRAGRSKNRKVFAFALGLNFSKSATSAKLRRGSYVVVQTDESEWDWSRFEWDPAAGAVLPRNGGKPIDLNHMVFGVSEFVG